MMMVLTIIRVTALLLLLGPVAVHAAWPNIGFPQGAQVEAIGDQVRLNGIPMRMYRVVSKLSHHDLVNFYRGELGDRRAESRVSDSVILAQERGDYFITVKIRALSAKVTEVLVSASDMWKRNDPPTAPWVSVCPLTPSCCLTWNRWTPANGPANWLSTTATRSIPMWSRSPRNWPHTVCNRTGTRNGTPTANTCRCSKVRNKRVV